MITERIPEIMKKLFLTISALLSMYNSLQGQQFKAVLVQLNTEQSRINYLRTAGKNNEADSVAAAAMAARTKMISDFNDNFKSGPVYFYVDSNIEMIKDRRFDGVLLNADYSTVKTPIINSADTDYLIVHYGKPDDNSTLRSSYALVICTWKFAQLYFINRPAPSDNKNMQYGYRSEKYNIEYFPSAKKFESTLGGAFSNPQSH